MKIEIDLTDAQAETLQRENEESNRGGEVPSLADFVVSLIVSEAESRQLLADRHFAKSEIDKMTPEEIAEFKESRR